MIEHLFLLAEKKGESSKLYTWTLSCVQASIEASNLFMRDFMKKKKGGGSAEEHRSGLSSDTVLFGVELSNYTVWTRECTSESVVYLTEYTQMR